FSGAATKTTGDLLLSVYAVNGTGNSVARTLKLARALPTAPTKLVLTDATTTVVAKAGVYAGKETPLTLTATPFLVQGAEATSYKWILPEGVTVTTGATEEADEIVGTRTWTGTDTVLTVNLELITTVMQLPMTVHAVNGAGTSLPKALTTVATALPSPVAAVAGSLNVCNREEGFVYTITAPFGANKYLITAPAGSVVSSTNGIATAVGGSLTNNELTTTDLTFKVVYSGTTAFLTTDKALKIQAGNATGFLTTAKSLTLVRKTTCVGLRAIDASVADEFSVTAYPNPSSSDFTIQASRKGATVKVYDMMGRLIEKRQATSNTVQVGSRCATGTYNVIVTQGANTKTLRVIKK
ncbi:T9SS type A sorting domain-containing protein, partial [Flavobacterium sp.]|uniref:T9SS type A sorting domain-containing protein n=1 Tax=Flavobacterium sp. TaxID=239 RepID=UPI0038FC2DCA